MIKKSSSCDSEYPLRFKNLLCAEIIYESRNNTGEFLGGSAE